MKKGLKKKLALILAFVMVMSTGIANVFTAFADDSVPVTVIKYWEDLGWNNNPDPPVHPHTFEFRWHDGTATNNIYLDPSSGFQALVQFSQTFINNLNNATDPYGLVSNHSVFDGQDWTGRFFDELGMSGYNTAVFIWDKETNTLRIFNSNADNFTLVHKEWIGGKAGANYSITLTATDYFGFEAHAATRADYIGGNYEGGSLSMTLNRDNGWSQPFFGITGGANWTVTEPQSNSWTSVTDPAQLIKYDDDEKEYYLYNIKNYVDTDIPVEKEWKNVPDGVTPPDVNVSITQEIEGIDQPVGTITLSNYDPGSHMSYGSFIGRLNGNYNFTENPVPAGYRFNGVRPEYDENGNLVKYVLENEYIGNADRRVVKIWQDLPDGVTPPETITVDLVGDDGSILETATLVYDPSTGQSEGWVSGNGQINENPVPSGYSLVGITLKTDDEGNEYWEVVNKYDGGGTGGKDRRVVKIWEGLPDGVTPPETLEVTKLDADGNPIGIIILNLISGTNTSEGYVGSEVYGLREDNIPAGYTFMGITLKTDDEGNEYWEVVNKYDGGGTGGKDRRVVKIWEGLPDGVTPPETLEVTKLDADGNPIGIIILNLISGTNTSEGYVGSDVYGLREDNVPAGYTFMGITLKTDDEGNEYWEIVNKYDGGGTGGKDRRVVKIWEGLPDGVTPPETLEVTKLDADGNPIGIIILNLISGTNTSEGYVGSDVYGLREDNVPAGYTFMGITLKTDDEGNEYWEIVNKYDGGGTGGKDRRVVKIWEGLPDGVTPPETLEVTKLDADGNPIGIIILNLISGTNTSEGYVGSDVYGLREDNIPAGYTFMGITLKTDDEGNEYWEIVNKYDGGGTGGKDRRVVKIWEGLPDGVTPPETLDVTTLDAEGNPIGTITLNLISGTNTSEGYVGSDVYGLREDNVPAGYTFMGITLKTDDEGNEYWEIVNKYDGGGTGGKDRRVVKIWEGLPDGVTPPEIITVDLVGDDGSILETVTLVYNPSTGQSEGWVSGNGQINENPVPSGYSLVGITLKTDDEGNEYWEIVNKYDGGGTGGKDRRVVKIWEGLPDGVTPPETLEVTKLDADGNPIGIIILNLISGTNTSEGYVGSEVYGLREDNIPAGYTFMGITLKTDDEGNEYWEVVNKYDGGGTGGKDRRVVKIWEGLPDGVTPPETLEVTTLDADGNPIGTTILNWVYGTNTSEGYADPGVAGIREDNVPNGYRFVSITWVDDDEGGHWEIINEYIGGKDTRVVKIWEGLPDGVTPPETLEVTTLDADGNPIGTVILYLVPGTNTSEGYVGPDVYGIREDNVPEGFTLVSITWVKDDDGGHWEIVNRYNKKPTPVIKNWLGRLPGEVPCTLTSVDVYDATGELVETVELTYDPETGTSIGYLTVTATEPLKFVENPVPDGWYYGGSSLKYDELGSAYYELINYRYYVADVSISSVEVIRGQYLVWTIVTSESISWLRLDGIYTPEGGSRKKTSVIYKSDTTSSNIERTVEDGVATWKIKMKFNYSEDVQSVIQSWTLSYKVADETAYRKANDDSPITITVYKDESTMTDVTGGYPSYSVVSVSGPETVAVGQYGTITVVTTSDCDKIRIGYDNGGKMKYATYQTTTKNNVSYVDDAETGLRTWTINYKFATDATQYTVQGRGPKWDAEKAQNFTVNFG